MKRSPAATLLVLLAFASMPTALGSMVRRVTSAGFGHETAQLQADDVPVRSRFASRSQIAFLAEEAFDGLERESNNWALYGGIGAGILACIGGTAFAMAGTKNSADQKEEEAREVVLGSQAAKNADMDAEKLVKTVAKRAVQMVGPKLAKANMVKGILEQHVYGFPLKAQAFLASEMYSTVGAVLKEMEAEEAMVMFGMGSDGSISVPPMSVLLAGLLSPVILSVSFFIHLLQVVVVLVPVAAMAGWAIWNDQETLMSCAVPGMWIWIYAIGALATILAIAHCISMASIASGKAQIHQKAEEMKDEILEAVGDGELTVEECRKIFLVSSVLLEHALMVEDNLRRSVWRNVIGMGTIAWFLLTIWNFWIVLIYTFVPGVVAFHPSAKEVAGDDYCGAWATVFTARLTCVLALLFVVFNMISMMQYISDQLVTSEGYFAGILGQAKKFDQSSVGVPVMQTMVKAFLLRGNGDTLASHIAHASNQQAALEDERDRLQSVKESLEGRIAGHKSEANQLRKELGLEEVIDAPTGPSMADKAAAMGDKVRGHADAASAAAREAGQMAEDAVADAKLRAAELEKVTREELENLIKKIMDAAEQVRNSEAVRQAIEQAEKAKEQAEQAAAMAQDPEVRARLLAEAQEAAERAAEAGMKQAEELKKQAQELAEQGMAQAEELKKQAQVLAEQGMEAAEKLANTPEAKAALAEAKKAMEAGKAHAEKAVEKGKEVVEKGKEAAEAAANSPEAQKAMKDAEKAVKEGKKAAEKASKEVSAAASQAVKQPKKSPKTSPRS